MPNPNWPSELVPLLEDWKEDLRLGRLVLRTRETFAAFSWSQRQRLMASGSVILDLARLPIWERFLADIRMGELPFSFWSFHRHPLLYRADAPYVAQMSRHRYDAQPVTSGWHVGWENLLPSSENLGDSARWVAVGGATITRTGGQTAPDGSPTAWRIQTSGGSFARKLDCFGYGGTTLPSGWGRWIGCWVRNLSSTKRVGTGFTGFGASVWLNPGQGWTFLSARQAPVGSFGIGLSFCADLASDSLDFLAWHPMAIAFEPDGSDIESQSKGDAYDYVPTPTGAYLAGDSEGRAYIWRELSGDSAGVVAGRIFAENAVLLAEQGTELVLSKDRIAQDVYRLRLLIGEV